jgi:magnesium transporter
MMDSETWTLLVDPDEAEIRSALRVEIHPTVLEQLARPTKEEREPRPLIRNDNEYLFGLLLVPEMALERESGIVFTEIDFIATPTHLLTVLKTPASGPPKWLEREVNSITSTATSVGMALWHIVDDIAEQFLRVVDYLDIAIDLLEDEVEEMVVSEHGQGKVRRQVSIYRKALLRLRRGLTPLRDATHGVVASYLDVSSEAGLIFPHDVEVRFAEVHEKLLRATDGLDLTRDLLSGVRDYHQGQIGYYQAEINKRLTAIASMLLVPTFVVGLYGQNLKGSPEMAVEYGWWISWAIIIVTTVLQYVYFKRKRWL